MSCPEPEEIVAMIRVCEENDDPELKAFLILAPTTGMRKGEILSRKWSDIDLDFGNPCIYASALARNDPTLLAKNDQAPLVNRYGLPACKTLFASGQIRLQFV